MKITRRTRKRFTSFLLIFFMVFESAVVSDTLSEVRTAEAASVPGFKAKVTETNVMRILNKYDTDSAYVIKMAKKAGDNDLMTWFDGNRIIYGMDTAVHEQTHGYSFRYVTDYNQTAYYIGKKRTIRVYHTRIYRTKKMASSVPKRLRTTRFNTYVGKPSANLASNVQGIYGLMNEFMAYRMGMSNTVHMYAYYRDQGAGWNEWMQYVNDAENDRQAYAEFKYYMLHYLYYAKKHYPTVYKGIINNKKFCRAYKSMEASYAKMIPKYEKQLSNVSKRMTKNGYHFVVTENQIFYYRPDGTGVGVNRFTKAYKKLTSEMKKTKYRSLHKKLVKNAS